MEHKISYIFLTIAFSCTIRSIIGVKIFPNSSELVINRDDSLTLNCSGNGLIRWSYPTRRTSSKKINYWNNSSELTITSTRYWDTGYYICQLENNASDSARIYIYSFDEWNTLLTTSPYVNATMYDRVIIPCISTSPNIRVSLTKMNTIVEPLEKYDPKIGFVVSTYPNIGLTKFTCAAYGANIDTADIIVDIYPPRNDSSKPYIEATDPIVEMQNVTMNCSVIIASNLGIKSMGWDFPEQIEVVPTYIENHVVDEKNIVEIKHTEFSTFFQTLSITNLTKNYEGNYSCWVIDGNSKMKKFTYSLNVITINSTFLNLTVAEKTRELTSQQTGHHSSVEFIASVHCFPKCKTTWYNQNNESIATKSLHLANNKYGIIDDEHETRLRINRVNMEDFGTYRIRATNPFHERSEDFSLILKDATHSTTDHTNTNNDWLLFTITGIIIFFIAGFLAGAFILHFRRLNKEKRELIKILQEFGLQRCKNTSIPTLDPELDIGKQTLLIPYHKKYEFPKEKLAFGKILGEGAFGVVKKAEADGIIGKNVKTTVAVKMAEAQSDFVLVKALLSEMKIMIYLGQHPNVVNLLGACTKDVMKGELAVIVEYSMYGNLYDFLSKRMFTFVNQITKNDEVDLAICSDNSNQRTLSSGSAVVGDEDPLNDADHPIQDESVFVDEATMGSEASLVNKEFHEPKWRSSYLSDADDGTTLVIQTVDLICWSYQVARGMEYLTSRNVLHGDLAARNILLAEGNVAKICNFGLAKSIYRGDQYQRVEAMPTLRWMAIESIRDRVFSPQSDVWSFGITMWEFFSLASLPYTGLKRLANLYQKLESGYRLEKPEFATDKIYEVMKSCWESQPASRPSFMVLHDKLGRLFENSIRLQSNELNKSENDVKKREVENYSEILKLPDCKNSTKDPVDRRLKISSDSESKSNWEEIELESGPKT